MGLLNLCQSIFASSLQYSNIPFFFLTRHILHCFEKQVALACYRNVFLDGSTHCHPKILQRHEDLCPPAGLAWAGGTSWVHASECTCLKKTPKPENNKKKPHTKKTPQNCQILLPQEIHLYEIKLDLIYFVTLLKSNICITMETSA